MQKALKPLGWRIVSNPASFAMWKKGCTLSLGGYVTGTQKLPEYISDVDTEIISKCDCKWNEWCVERVGWIIDSGFITRSVGDAAYYGYQNQYLDEWCDLIKRIDNLTTTEPIMLSNKRLGLLPQPEVVQIPKPYLHRGPIRDTTIFCTKEFTGDTERFYRIIDIEGTNLIIARFNKTLTDYDKVGIQISANSFKEKEASGSFRAIEVHLEETVITTKKLSALESPERGKIPEQITRLGLSAKQLSIVSEGIAKCMNITPLLNSKLDASEEFINAISVSKQDLNILQESTISEETSKYLAQIIRSGINVKPYVDTTMNPEYIKLQLEDAISALQFNSAEIKSTGVQAELADAIAVANTYGIDAYSCFSPLHVDAWIYANNYGIQKSMSELFSKGVLNPDGSISLNWSQCSNKQELFQFFADNDFECDERGWTTVLSTLFDKALYLKYSKNTGMCIRDVNGILGRDYNGFVIFDQLYTPIWRAIKVNEEYICYGNFTM